MERSEFPVHGKNLDDEERKKAAQRFEQTFQEGVEPIEGESEKSEEVLRYVEKINGYLNEELRGLGLDEVQLDPRRIHFLRGDFFQKKFPSEDPHGFFQDGQGAVYMNQDRRREQIFKSLLHETVHQLSWTSGYANSETRETHMTRSGYVNYSGVEDHHQHFRGMNEAIVDTIVKEILDKHAGELTEEFRGANEEKEKPVSYYDDYMEVLDLLMTKMAQKNNETKEAVWARFKKGEFTGEMMHLRDVESTFGKGALRVLAAMGSGTKDMKRSSMIAKMKAYFETEDPAEQERIAKEVLIERERLRYEQRRS